jgi:quercetin dioxygenase-like cupin family protein
MAGTAANPDGGPNGPGCGGLAVGSRRVETKAGDVLIVPPGVIHGWADIPDHVDYLSFHPSHGVMKNG